MSRARDIANFGDGLTASEIPNLAASKITSGTFATAIIADDAINLDKLAHLGTDGHVLTSTGTGSAPAFEAVTMPTNSILQAKYAHYGGTNTVAMDQVANDKDGPSQYFPTTVGDSELKITLNNHVSGSKVIICANVVYGVSAGNWTGPVIKRSVGGSNVVLSTENISGTPATSPQAFIHSFYNNVATSAFMSPASLAAVSCACAACKPEATLPSMAFM